MLIRSLGNTQTGRVLGQEGGGRGEWGWEGGMGHGEVAVLNQKPKAMLTFELRLVGKGVRVVGAITDHSSPGNSMGGWD